MRRLAWFALALMACQGSPASVAPQVQPPTAEHAGTIVSTAPEDRHARGEPLEVSVPLLAGGSTPLGALRGKVVILELSATDVPGWHEGHERYQRLLSRVGAQQLVVVTVANDASSETLQDDWDRDPPPFVLGWDPQGAMALRMGIRELPVVLVLDRQGAVVGRVSSTDASTQAQVDRWVEYAVRESAMP